MGCSKQLPVDVLITAASDGNVAECERLIKNGLPVDATDDSGDTALNWAVYNCKAEVVQKLIQLGANVNHIDQLGMTPLMHTATALRGRFLRGTQEQRTEIARVLIEHGANVNRGMGNGRLAATGQTALHFAACDKNVQLVRLLLSSGANPKAKDTHGLTPLDMAKAPVIAPNEEVVRALRKPLPVSR